MRSFLTFYISILYRFLLIILVLSFGNQQMFAQNILKGIITDLDGIPIHGVTVYSAELHRATTTNIMGEFKFSDIHYSELTLQSSHIGYVTQTRSYPIIPQMHLRVLLTPLNKKMNEIVVNGSSHSTKNFAYTTGTVTAAEIKNSGQNTLMETLSTKAGVDIIATGGIGKPVIRGLSFNKIALYSMGTKIESQQWDDDHDAGIADAGIEKVEIVYGPSALMYGADALGGAIIFVDENNAPLGKTNGNISIATFSNTKGINAATSINHTFPSGAYLNGYLNNQSHCDYMPGTQHHETSKVFALNSRYQTLSAKVKGGMNKKWGYAKLSYSYLRSFSGIVADGEEDSVALANGTPYKSNDREMMGHYFDVTTQVISSENSISAGASKFNLDVSFQQNNRKEFLPQSTARTEDLSLGLLLNTFNYNLKWSSNSSKTFGVTLGTQGMFQHNRNYGVIIATPNAVIVNYSLYGLMHYYTGNWNFLAGVRMDHRNLHVAKTSGAYEDETSLDSMESAALDALDLKRKVSNFKKEYIPFNLSAGVVYQPTESITFKSNVASGFSAPNFGELSTFWKHEGTYKFEIGNQNLTPQHNLEGDINLLGQFKNVHFSAAAFYNYIYNYIYLAPTKDSAYDLQIVAFMQKNATITGGELAIGVHPAQIKGLELNSALSITAGRIGDGTYLPYFPSNKLTSELKFEADTLGKLISPYFSIKASHHFAQNKPALYETPTHAYSLFDISFGADLRLFRQCLHGVLFCTNVFNTAYYNHLSLLKVIGVHDRGRNIGFKLTIPFGN